MAVITSRKAKVIIGDQSYDISNTDFNMRVPEMSDEEWKEFIKTVACGEITFTGYWSYWYPIHYYRWHYRRQILNPGYSRYRRYLIE